jgi:sulfatase maturation enzyme AslB (radical SAM superfamily)
MHCPRLDHYIRLNQDGTVGKCGHMVGERGFKNCEDLEKSKWLSGIKSKMASGLWPDECIRCQQSEKIKGKSVRTNSIDRHKLLYPVRKDYLIIGGVLDNVCNSACQSCYSGLSTKIGSLENKVYPRVDNYEAFRGLPLERALELDVNGGEPTASKNYKRILRDIPANIRIVRMNTNGYKMISEIEEILKKNIMVIVTLSFDGTDKVHDYCRWPVKWKNYQKTVDSYLALRDKYKLLKLDFWTTVSCLNVANLPDIMDFAKTKNIPIDWAFLHRPSVLNVRFTNHFTLKAKKISPDEIAIDEDNTQQLNDFIVQQDKLRGIDIKDYLNF